MKTLYDRLKPDYKSKLDKIKGKYPYVNQSLISDLTKNYFIIDLQFSTAINLHRFLGVEFSELGIYDAFEDAK